MVHIVMAGLADNSQSRNDSGGELIEHFVVSRDDQLLPQTFERFSTSMCLNCFSCGASC